MNNSELVNVWLTHQQRERGRSTTTLYTYRRDGVRLLRYVGGRRLGSVSTDDLRGFVHAPVERGSRRGEVPSAATVKRRVAMLRSMFRFLHAEGLVPTDPAVRLVAPTVRNEHPRPCDWEDWRVLWRSGLSDDERVAFGLALFGGLRRSEVVAVRAGHFDGPVLAGFRRKGGQVGSLPWLSCVRFFAEKDPTLLGGDVSSFLDPLGRLLRDRRDELRLLPWAGEAAGRRVGRAAVLPTTEVGAIDPTHLNRYLRRALVGAGLPGDAFTPHQLRHGFCTFLLAHGVPLLDVSRLAGHSNVTVTQRYIATQDDPLIDLLDQGGSDLGVFARI